MTQNGGFGLRWPLVRIGNYVFAEHFPQRKITKTFGSMRSLIPLRTASGPQWAESALEAKAIQQFAFQPFIYDIFTQPIIRYDQGNSSRTYTPDILVQFSSGGPPPVKRYVIEVKRQAALELLDEGGRERIQIGRRFAKTIKAGFRILTEAEIDTPYLTNVRLLESHLRTEPCNGFQELRELLEVASLTWRDAYDRLIDQGISRPDARTSIERAIALRVASCDLSAPINEHTMLSKPKAVRLSERWKQDPFLLMVHHANDGSSLVK